MKITIESLVEGGAANAGPPLGPALGPLGVNIGQIIAAINDKTKDFKGMKVPVKVVVDKDTKKFEIEVGSPPVSGLILKECGAEKGAKTKEDKIGNLSMAQVVKIAKMKRGSSLAKELKGAVNEVIGTCLSLGVTVEGQDPRKVISEVNNGKYNSQIS